VNSARHGSMLVACLLTFAGASTPLISTASAAASSHGFRLLPVTATVNGKSRAELVVLGYSAKVLAKKEQIETKDCTARPQFGTTAEGAALGKVVFNLPAQLGKSMSCKMSASSMLMIDEIGVICNDSKRNKASVECIEKRFSSLRNFRVTFDGHDLGAGRYRVISDQFVLDLPKASPFGLHEGKWRLRAGGWPILLADLAPGDHTIETSYQLGRNRQSTKVILTVGP
jgi:hypothetical protein